MKRTFILSTAFFILFQVWIKAQNVGINDDGSTPDNSAILDVKSTNKGILIPNIALTGANDATTIGSPAIGLLIYNTAIISGLTPGYYYNAGTVLSPVWARLETGTAGINIGDMQYWNATDWIILPVGSAGQVLTMNASNTPVWQNASNYSYPIVATAIATEASDILMTSAILNGNVNANGFSTDVNFEYGTTTDYGRTSVISQSPVTGHSVIEVNSFIIGLIANTVYHFRIKASNAVGISFSDDMSFTTSGQLPFASTQASTNITLTEATLNGIINANGFSTAVTFEYGLTLSYGSSVDASPSTVTGNNNTSVTANIANLSPGTTYHFRVKAVNSYGTTYGDDLIFTSLGGIPTVTTLAPSAISAESATLRGTVNANYF